jgi:hypothetical protein
MSPLAGRLARTAAGLAGLIAFQPLLCLWAWGYKVVCALFLLECFALAIFPASGAFFMMVGWGRWAFSSDPERRREGRNLMRTAAVLALAGPALFLGGYLAVRLGPL